VDRGAAFVTCCPATAGLGAIVLAAGSSRRLGGPKQLLELHGEPLVRRAARVAVEAGFWPVVVVLGPGADRVRSALAGMPLVTAHNPEHEEGLASSIRTGLRRLRVCCPDLRGAMLLACDQPDVDEAHLDALAQAAQAEHKTIAASAYGDDLGVPALVLAEVFPELLALTGDLDARALLGSDRSRVAAVPAPAGSLDVDTDEDWQRALAQR
jgi:molybdenum cofactor cytidylyltransferase